MFLTERAPDWNWSELRMRCLHETERVLGGSADAEDAAQEAIIRAWRQRMQCRQRDRPGPWVVTIARREALRLAGARRELQCDSVPERPSREEDEILRRSLVRQAIVALADEERWLLFAHYWQDLANDEISRRLGCAEPTVRVRLHRLRGRLKESLREP